MSLEEEPRQYLVARIRDALACDPRVGQLDIKVKAAGSKVFLTGTVTTEERKRVVGEVVRELVPELEVHNEVTVSALSEVDEVERLS